MRAKHWNGDDAETPTPSKASTPTGQITSTLDSLSDEQLNTKLAKMIGWKLVNGKWWHDDIGDGPPTDAVKVYGRGTVETIVAALMEQKGATQSVGAGDSSTATGASSEEQI